MRNRLVADEIATGFGFLEGPRWYQGRLWVSDFHRRLVFAIDPGTGNVETVCAVPNQPSGLSFASTGDMFVVSMLDRRVLRLRDRELTTFADLSRFTPHPINDMVIDARDRMYVTSFGCTPWLDQKLDAAPVLRVDPDGTAEVVSRDMTFPNGLVFSADERTLYVADQFGCRLGIYAVAADGGLSFDSWHAFAPTVHDSMPSGWASRDFLPDGIARDDDGFVWASNANGGDVARVDPPSGRTEIWPIEDFDQRVYAVAFGPDGTLYACVAPRVETWDVDREFPSRLVRLRPC